MEVEERIAYYREQLAIIRLDQDNGVVDRNYGLSREMGLMDRISYEISYKEAYEKGVKIGKVTYLFENGFTKEEIMKMCNVTMEDIEEILENERENK